MANTISGGEPPAVPAPPVTTRRALFVRHVSAQVRAHGSLWTAVALLIACSFWLGSRLGDSLPFGNGPGVHLTTWAPAPVARAPLHSPTPHPAVALRSPTTTATTQPAESIIPAATPASSATQSRPTIVATQPASSAGSTIDINSASIEGLHRVLGVRRSTAQRIVLYRQRHGPFASLDDLLAVPLSRSTIERIGAHIVFR